MRKKKKSNKIPESEVLTLRPCIPLSVAACGDFNDRGYKLEFPLKLENLPSGC